MASSVNCIVFSVLGLYKNKPILTTIRGVVAGEMPSEAACHARKTKVMHILSTSLPGNLMGKTPDWPTGAAVYVLIVRYLYLIRLLQEEFLAVLAMFAVKWAKLNNERSHWCPEN